MWVLVGSSALVGLVLLGWAAWLTASLWWAASLDRVAPVMVWRRRKADILACTTTGALFLGTALLLWGLW